MKHLVLLAVLCGLVLPGCGRTKSEAPEDILARVNGKDITAAELEKQYLSRISGADQPPSPAEAQDLKLQLLSQMISDVIFAEMAAKQKLTATDAEVDTKFNEFKSQYTDETLKESLKQSKTTVEEIRADIRKSLTLEHLINKEITSKISVSEQEIKDFYEKNKKDFNLPPGFRISHIFVSPRPDAEIRNIKQDDAKNEGEAISKAARLLREIQGGADFATVARNYSEDPGSAPAGGDLNFQSLEAIANIDPRLAQVVQRLKIGETAPQVVETRAGYHVVKLLDRDPGGQKDLSDVRVQTQVRQFIFNGKDQTLKAAFSEVARNGAQITNFMAQRILDKAGEAVPAAAEKTEDKK